MSIRVVKHLGARACPADDSRVLMAVPYFVGEKIKSISMDCYFASGAASAIDQPGECNWYGLSIPWSLVYATSLLDAGNAITGLGTVPLIDSLYKQWLLAVDESATQYFGGDADLDPEKSTGEEGHSTEELIDSGPIGVQRWFNRERIMQPMAAEGNTVIRFGDSFTTRTTKFQNAGMGGLLLFGMVRYEFGANTEFNVEHDDATVREALGLLLAGDYTKVKARIEGDTSTFGDFLRTVLFGGDNYIEADTLKGPAGNGFVKATISIETAISRFQ